MSIDGEGTPIIPSAARVSIAKNALGPAAKKFGEKIEPLGDEVGEVTVKAVRLALRAGSTVVWGFEKVADWLQEAVQNRLNGVPKEKLTESNPRILYPTAQALIYTAPDQKIRELFANLIASDMNTDTKGDVHPAFVEMIKEMTAEDAKVLEFTFMYGPQRICEYRRTVPGSTDARWNDAAQHVSINLPDLTFDQLMVSVSNLERLGILVTEDFFPITDQFDEYEKHYEQSEGMQALYADAARNEAQITKNKRGI